MKKNTLLGITGVGATGLVVALVSLMQPEANAKSSVVEPAPVTAKAAMPENVSSNPAITPKANNPATPPSQIELLQQREALYMDFQALSFALSHGQQPDNFKVSQMLNQQLQLVNAGVVPSEDALTYSRFLKKIMPQMNAELTQHIEKLEHVKHAS